jgi:hypothetical protein
MHHLFLRLSIPENGVILPFFREPFKLLLVVVDAVAHKCSIDKNYQMGIRGSGCCHSPHMLLLVDFPNGPQHPLSGASGK